jgi:hypothetical protein
MTRMINTTRIINEMGLALRRKEEEKGKDESSFLLSFFPSFLLSF